CAMTEAASSMTRSAGSSSRSTPRMTPRARVWASPSQASSPSAWRGTCSYDPSPGTPFSRSRFRRSRLLPRLPVEVLDIAVGTPQNHVVTLVAGPDADLVAVGVDGDGGLA